MNDTPDRSQTSPAPATSAAARVHLLARRARQRITVRAILEATGPALAVGFAAGLLAVIVLRTFDLTWPWWWAPAAAAAAGLIAGVSVGIARRKDLLRSASELDTLARLKDRLSSALALEKTSSSDPFAALAVADAERVAARVDVRSAIPVRLGRSWTVWPALALATAAASLWLPPMNLWGTGPTEAEIREAADRRAAAEELRRALEDVDAADPLADQPADPQMDERLAMLDQLVKDLEQGSIDPDEARAEAAKVADEIASDLEEQADQAEQQQRSFEDLAAEAAARTQGNADKTKALKDAMQRRDLPAVQQALEDLASQADQLPEDEQRDLGEELEELGKSIEEEAQSRDELLDNLSEKMQQSLEQQGLPSDQAQQLANQRDAQQIAKSLREQGLTAEDAERLSEQISDANQQRGAQQNATEAARQLAEQLQNAGQAAQQQANQSSSQQQQSSQPMSSQSSPQSSPSSQQQSQQGQEQSQQQNMKSNRPLKRSDSQPNSSQSQQQAPEPDPLDMLNKKQKKSAQQQQQQQPPQQGQQQPQQISKDDYKKEQGECSNSLGGAANTVGGQCNGGGNKPAGARQQAQALRKLGGGAGSGAGAWSEAKRPPIEGMIDDDSLDLRRPTDEGVITGEMQLEEVGEVDSTTISRRELVGEFKQMAESTQKAMEDRRVPGRYRSVEKYFRKSIERNESDDAQPSTPPPAPDAAEDVEPASDDSE